MPPPGHVCLGRIATAHGVRGGLKVRSHTAAPEDLAAYGPLVTATGRTLDLRVVRVLGPDMVLATVAGVEDRDAALALRGIDLFVPRTALPEPADEDDWYHADLIGLAVVLADGTPLGRVRAVHDFGAGDVLELDLADGDTGWLPFTRAAVPEVSVAQGRLVADPPPGWRGDAGPETDGPEIDGPDPDEVAADADAPEGDVP